MLPSKDFLNTFKKRGTHILLVLLLLVVLFNPNAKAWLLQQFISTGLFNTKITKEDAVKESSLANQSFTITDFNGDVVTAESLKGKVVFINFWASWCPPCRAEMPSLATLYNKLKDDKQIVFLFVNEDTDKKKAIKYLQEHDLSLPVYFPSSELPDDLFSGTLPTTVVLDKAGKIVLKHEGIANYNNAAFIQQLQELN